ncbi:bifunctional 2-dehydro-3-deoxygluconokinase/2-dehydro-3-deoxygalactonokinase [Halapricum hydrolyticum]|uniref:Sugar kinase n=1 Tax=Halapricum hydrolyticum TaxID=2979991 RepID=A0AAE3LFC3_9EURY|nr:bifunctional 2-dehydro-3-deoxygluconokinase/2-dehydro-3-deoxygalactonokinase [Halapricum hydrolyticum]MCU4718524.1 sugar kinase [Halapricum hydrolyticum]MCU4727457.1 sugar kinase [Halapricum hydrolyticum]
MTDLVTFGETMLRLTPPRGRRLEQVTEFDVAVGGAESNVAVAAAQFEHDVRWLSRLPDSPLGRRVSTELRRHGVEPAVDWTTGGRVGTYYLERGGKPRGANVVYDRDRSAFDSVAVEDLPVDRLSGAKMFHTSGITPGLSDATAAATEHLLETAVDAGVRTSFDLNYRSKIWDPDAARETIEPLLSFVDVLFAPERDAATVLGLEAEAPTQANRLANTYDVETVVVTRGTDGVVCRHDGETFEQPIYETDTLDPVGTGDAFVGGFLATRLDGADCGDALAYAAATAALKRTIEGDMALVSPKEVEAVVESGGVDISR